MANNKLTPKYDKMKIMTSVDEIILHCSATKEKRFFCADDIRNWHMIGNGWNDIAYHYVIQLDGTIEEGRPIKYQGGHTKGRNAHSIGICYIGGLGENMNPKDTRTDEQKASLVKLVTDLLQKYPNAKVKGHYHYANKPCPCFSVEDFMMHNFNRTE